MSGSASVEIGESPRCCPVLRGLRDRCIAAMLATQSGSQWSCSTSCGCSSVRLPTGGGTLVRFDFHEIGGPGWIRTINLPIQSRALCWLSYRAVKWSRLPVLPRSDLVYRTSAWLLCQAGVRVAEAGGHAPHPTQWNDLFSRQSRHACPVQLP